MVVKYINLISVYSSNESLIINVVKNIDIFYKRNDKIYQCPKFQLNRPMLLHFP